MPKRELSHHTSRSTQRRIVGAVTAGLVMLLGSPPLVYTASAAGGRPFAVTSPFNVPIGASPRLDANSSAMVARASRTGEVHANLVAYGIPVYTSTDATPRYQVSCDMAGVWGTCPLAQQPMPIPVGARPNSGEDGVLTVIDPATNTVAEYWRARSSGSGWAAAFGAVNSLAGSGWGGASTGSGASRLAGVVRVSEIQAGTIPHALVLQSDNVCSTTFRAPALKTDGNSNRSDCIPEGARLQLDPGLDLQKLGLSAAEKTVAKAMQTYGGYVIDRSGTSLSVSFERATDATASSPGSVYRAAGLAWDYHGMPDVPWQRLRVLKTWQG